MKAHPKSNETLVRRLLPSVNSDRVDRTCAWSEWQSSVGELSVLKFIRTNNYTNELDEDILQDTMLTAYLEVERGRYELREGIPFTAYVKGIARNKIREARRKGRYVIYLEDIDRTLVGEDDRHLETGIIALEYQEALYASLGKLPRNKRHVLERYLQGRSTEEIAHELSMNAATVRQHKCRGLRRLKQIGLFSHSS